MVVHSASDSNDYYGIGICILLYIIIAAGGNRMYESRHSNIGAGDIGGPKLRCVIDFIRD